MDKYTIVSWMVWARYPPKKKQKKQKKSAGEGITWNHPPFLCCSPFLSLSGYVSTWKFDP